MDRRQFFKDMLTVSAAAGIAAAPLAIGILSALYAKTEALIPQQAEK